MNCKNCNTSLLNHQKFCLECGAKVIKNRLTLKNIFEDINDQFINIDNIFLKTFIHLFTKPELVISGYINGTRKQYISVIQYFAISLTLVGIQLFLMNTFFKDALNMDALFGDSFKKLAEQKDNPFSPSNFDYNQINNYQSLIYVLTVPFSALSTWLAYVIVGDKQLNFTEHLVLNLYYSAQIIIVTSLLTIIFLCFGLDYMLITSCISIITFIYWFYVLKRVFNHSFLDTLARFMLAIIALVVIFFGIIIICVIIGIIITLTQKA